MILLFLVNLYLGVNLNEKTAGNSFQNDYSIGIQAKAVYSRICYTTERVNGIQNYSMTMNGAGDKAIKVLTNIFDKSSLDIAREDLTLGVDAEVKNIHNFFTTGLSFNKYRDYEPCFRYGLWYINKIQPNTGSELADLLLGGLIFKFTYEVRAEFLVAKDRYQYGLETSNDFYFTKMLGVNVSGFYGKYNTKEYHEARTAVFVNF